MAALPGIPQSFYVQSANQQILVSWAQAPGATSYIVSRSQDNITYTVLTTLSGSPLATSFVDTTAVLGTQYWYTVSAVNVTGASPSTTPQSAVAAPVGEMTLGQLRLAAMQRADRVNSNFVTIPEWDFYINQSMFELYDLLVTVYEDYFIAPPVIFTATNNQYMYPLPNGSNTFQNQVGGTFTPQALYKLTGVDMALNTTQNAFVTVNKFNFIDRNKYVYPTSGSTIFGIYNMRYRMVGPNIEFIPPPANAMRFQLWYVPRLTQLLQDTDTTVVGISGWTEYILVKAAYLALAKEESDTTQLLLQLAALQKRIEETAANRDAGQADTVSDTRSASNVWGNGPGWSGSGAGW